jgi:2-polyprenyl-3-methyl-5-hydroxy-6-metoxy-1,4-benzoquinol methylase
MVSPYTKDYFRARRMGEALNDAFDTEARALKGYRRGARLLGPLQTKRVLDVGCGLGAGSWLLASSGADVTGVDISEDAIEWARHTYAGEADRRGYQVQFWQADLLALGSGLGEFDALTVVDVLEHFPPHDGRALLATLARLLTPGGVMFLHVPVTANALDWLLVAKNGLLRKRLRGEVLDHHGDPTHATRYSVRSISRLLVGAGWQTRKLELRAYAPRLRYLEHLVKTRHRSHRARAAEQLVTDWDGVHTFGGRTSS